MRLLLKENVQHTVLLYVEDCVAASRNISMFFYERAAASEKISYYFSVLDFFLSFEFQYVFCLEQHFHTGIIFLITLYRKDFHAYFY